MTHDEVCELPRFSEHCRKSTRHTWLEWDYGWL